MRKSELRGRILMQIERLIAQSCVPGSLSARFQNLHESIIKKHYNAAEVSIDYHRQRVKMAIVLDDEAYDPKSANLDLPTFPANFYFKNLCDFLKSCIGDDQKSLAFYSGILKNFTRKDTGVMMA
jgi:hypothetical protein